jgi:hypothetical protein
MLLSAFCNVSDNFNQTTGVVNRHRQSTPRRLTQALSLSVLLSLTTVSCKDIGTELVPDVCRSKTRISSSKRHDLATPSLRSNPDPHMDIFGSPAIIEKAYAKINGGYDDIVRGYPRAALLTLTGNVPHRTFTSSNNLDSAHPEIDTFVKPRHPGECRDPGRSTCY